VQVHATRLAVVHECTSGAPQQNCLLGVQGWPNRGHLAPVTRETEEYITSTVLWCQRHLASLSSAVVACMQSDTRHNLVEAHTYVLHEQQSRFRAMYAAIVHYV